MRRRHGWTAAVVVAAFAPLAWAEARSFGKPLAGLKLGVEIRDGAK